MVSTHFHNILQRGTHLQNAFIWNCCCLFAESIRNVIAWHRKALATAVVKVGGIKKNNKRGKCRVTWKLGRIVQPKHQPSLAARIPTYVHMFLDMYIYIYIYIMYVYAPKATHINYVRYDINIIKRSLMCYIPTKPPVDPEFRLGILQDSSSAVPPTTGWSQVFMAWTFLESKFFPENETQDLSRTRLL